MSDNYDEYLEELRVYREANEKYFDGFHKWLMDSGLKEKTVKNHVDNVYVYINSFLCYYEIPKIADGCHRIGRYLGDWFIRKTMWSSCSTIKSTAASIKKFYKYMCEAGIVELDDYEILLDEIKEEMPYWLEKMERYDNMY